MAPELGTSLSLSGDWSLGVKQHQRPLTWDGPVETHGMLAESSPAPLAYRDHSTATGRSSPGSSPLKTVREETALKIRTLWVLSTPILMKTSLLEWVLSEKRRLREFSLSVHQVCSLGRRQPEKRDLWGNKENHEESVHAFVWNQKTYSPPLLTTMLVWEHVPNACSLIMWEIQSPPKTLHTYEKVIIYTF